VKQLTLFLNRMFRAARIPTNTVIPINVTEDDSEQDYDLSLGNEADEDSDSSEGLDPTFQLELDVDLEQEQEGENEDLWESAAASGEEDDPRDQAPLVTAAETVRLPHLR
jgi:hypothetical protein